MKTSCDIQSFENKWKSVFLSFQVGQVLKDRKKRGQIEYLIRWKNFGAEEDSWEPESNLKNAGSILQDYIKNKATRVSIRTYFFILTNWCKRLRFGLKTYWDFEIVWDI